MVWMWKEKEGVHGAWQIGPSSLKALVGALAKELKDTNIYKRLDKVKG